MITAGQHVVVSSPQGSAFQGQLGVVRGVTGRNAGVEFSHSPGITLAFGVSELVVVSDPERRRAAVEVLREMHDLLHVAMTWDLCESCGIVRAGLEP